MKVQIGNGLTEYGPGVEITLTGDDVARAIDSYLYAHDIIHYGARTIRIDGKLCGDAKVYVSPEGHVMAGGKRYNGNGVIDD